VDLDGDGTRDIISGSYMPGDIFFFFGRGKGAFAPGVKLMGADGKPARAGLASSVAVADWDHDGKLDLVVGNIGGEVWLLPQVGRKEGLPVYGAGVELRGADRILRTANGVTWSQSFYDAGPLVGDWDGDGVDDLLVGYDDGSVQWSKAVRDDKGRISLAKAVELIPSREDPSDAMQFLASSIAEKTGSDPWRSQERAKLALADWNGDGRQDLLVGDFSSEPGPEPVLTAADLVERHVLETERSHLDQKYSEVYQLARAKVLEKLGISSDDSGDEDDEATARIDELVQKDEDCRKVREGLEKNWKKLAPLTAQRKNHGYVWVYLRATPATADVKR
jgi:hypothetical protein